jgi:diguanylate cyclase (GGDEF)-like protein
VCFNQLILCYLFQQFDQAIANADLAEPYLEAVTATALVPLFRFYDALARLAAYSQTTPAQQKQTLQRVRSAQKQLHSWADHAPDNHLHRVYLLQAELHRVLGQRLKAMDSYDRAIALAQEHQYVHEEALAQELAARFYLAQDKGAIAQIYLQNALYCYSRWGAKAKVKQMEAQYPHLLKKLSMVSHSSVSVDTRDTINRTGESLDLATVMKASQAISEEILLSKLLTKLMAIVVENAGAEIGYFIRSSQQDLCIEAWDMGANVADRTAAPYVLPVDSLQHLPMTVIRYVERTQEAVVIDDAQNSALFGHDPCILKHQPRSILCTPVLHQGRISGIIYLENNLATGAFAADRVNLLNLLCAQAAISIENAQLYRQLEKHSRTLQQRVLERTQALREANRQLQRQANSDGLTGLANRRYFDEYMDREWRRAKREHFPLALILCDVDYFKAYNDTYGHQTGDDCLRQVAQAIQANLKRPADFAARYGGEEFAVVLPNTNLARGRKVAEHIRTGVHGLKLEHTGSGVSQWLTLSLGVASIVPGSETSPASLIDLADQALYQAKRTGRDRIQCCPNQ